MSFTLEAGAVRVELVKGDIAEQAVDAIVVPTSPELSGEGEVASRILEAGGPSVSSALAAARESSAPVALSANVKTEGGDLPAKNVIYAVGPQWKDGYFGEFVALERAYVHALQVAIAEDYESLAAVSISTGGNGFPDDRAAYVAFNTFIRELREQSGKLQVVRFVVKDDAKFEVYAKIWAEVRRTMMG